MPSPPAPSLLDRLLPDRLLAALSWVLLIIVVVAVVRGQHQWWQVPRSVWFHLATLGVVLALTPVILSRRKGDNLHRKLGWIWAVAMFSTAIFSLTITPANGNLFSPISILSIFVLIMVPHLILRARAHDLKAHRSTVRGLVIGALLIAGFFTFPFDRLLGHWLLG